MYSAANEDMGRVVDVIVKRNGEVRAAVIDFGGFLGVGSRTIAVDWSALRFPTSGPNGRHHPEAYPRPGQAGPRIQARRTSRGARLGDYNPIRKLQRLSTNLARRPTTARRSPIGPGEG